MLVTIVRGLAPGLSPLSTSPAGIFPTLTATLTTIALDNSSLQRFEARVTQAPSMCFLPTAGATGNAYCASYYIVGNNDVWMIQDAEKSSNEATLFAIAAAQKLAMRGERAHVCMLDDDGRLRCKWSYNRDRYLHNSTSDS
jgi:hypothetical protein